MRVTGPMMSIDASGTFAKTLVAAKWKGRNYMRAHAIPSNPRSAGQTAFRAMFKFLGSQWSSIATGDQETWATDADNEAISPFNAYQRYNQKRWANFLAPSQINPADLTGTPATVDTITATAGVRQITLAVGLSNLTDNWGLIIFRKVGADPANVQTEVIAVVEATASPVTYVDNGLTPGTTYHYEVQPFTLTGEKGAVSAADSATPTS
jgi:hypothetical protein